DDGILEGTIIDITDRKTAQQQVEYQAYHDSLTGLPNRALFRDRIAMALAHAKRTKRGAAVLFLDIDQFKLVNDTLGHTIGDRMLQVIAARLIACVRGEDTVARMGGDEFTVLIAEVGDRRATSVVAQKVLEAVRQPVVVDDHELFVEIATGRTVGAEALVRWHRDNVMVQPDDFISIAEECNLVVPLGEWVMRTACEQMKRWHAAGHDDLRVAVNLSARQLQQRE